MRDELETTFDCKLPAMFEVVGEITNIQVIATGRGIRRLKILRRAPRRSALAKTQG